jgi:diacylglycerol kinase (ATP)
LAISLAEFGRLPEKGEEDMSKKNKSIRVKLIANPGAGDVLKASARLEQVTRYLLDDGLKVDVALAKPKKEAIPIARKAIKDGYDVVIAMGGDGTIGAVIRGIAGSKVKLGVIPAGTENDIARSLGIPEDMKEACAIIAAGHTRKLDLGQISTKERKKFYFFMVSAIGLTATLYPEISEVPEGKWIGIKDAVMTILKYKTNPIVNLTLDDESKIEVETMLVTIANTPISGVKNLVAPDASMEDGLLDISVYPGFSKAELLNYFVKSAHEGETPDGRIQRYRAKNIKIKTSPKLDIAAEGIILGKGSAKIKVLPRALRVLAPEPGPGTEKPLEKTTEELPEPVSPVAKK